jgi:hypothetical protein
MTIITPITLEEWRTRVRNRSDLYDSAFVSDGLGDGYDGYGGELCTFINDALGTSYDFLIEVFGDEFFLNECTSSIVSSPSGSQTNIGSWIGTISTIDNYPISPWKLLSVKFKYNDYYYPCKRIQPNQVVLDYVRPRRWVPEGVFYTYHWEYIKFYPNPDSKQTVSIQMIPALKVLYYPTDYLNLVTVSTQTNQHPLEKFADLTVLQAAIKCLNKQERDTSALQLELEQYKDHIRKNAPRLDRTPRTIVDAQKNKSDSTNWYYQRWNY